MLNLDSPRWGDLEHAYGMASDTPALLRQLSDMPSSEGNTEPWYSLWSSLAHQGSVFAASFAAVPHVVAALAKSPQAAGFDFFQFPAWVEICRLRNAVTVPPDLQMAYFAALAQLPALAAAVPSKLRDPGFLASALSAVAASAGQAEIAEAVLELTSAAQAKEFLGGRGRDA